jgi:hypothetical protein
MNKQKYSFFNVYYRFESAAAVFFGMGDVEIQYSMVPLLGTPLAFLLLIPLPPRADHFGPDTCFLLVGGPGVQFLLVTVHLSASCLLKDRWALL